jgi:glycopeptide antibiotics resistance protein
MKKKYIALLFIIYLIVVLKITVFRDGFAQTALFSSGELYLVPFADLIHIYKNSITVFLYLFAGNIIWFVPFGVFMRALTKWNNIKIIFFAFLFSFTIEFLQYAFGTGISELDDLILNTFGACIGILVCMIVSACSKKRSKKRST